MSLNKLMLPKTFLPLAIVISVAAPAAHAIDLEITDHATVSVYGSIEPELGATKDGNGDTQGNFKDNDSTLGIHIENEFGSSVTGIAQAEFEHSVGDGGGLNSTDSAFLGLRGSFGRILAGNFDGVYEDSIIDATEVAEEAEITDEAVASEKNQIAYYSPSFSGFSVQTQVRYLGEGDSNNSLDKDGVGAEIVGSYATDLWEFNVGYEYRGAEAVTQYNLSGGPVEADFADESTLGTSAIVNLDPVQIGAKLAVQNNVDNAPAGDDTRFAALRGTYDYGPGEVYASVQQVSPDEGDDRTEATAGINYSMYVNLSFWAEAGSFDKINDEDDTVRVGAIFTF